MHTGAARAHGGCRAHGRGRTDAVGVLFTDAGDVDMDMDIDIDADTDMDEEMDMDMDVSMDMDPPPRGLELLLRSEQLRGERREGGRLALQLILELRVGGLQLGRHRLMRRGETLLISQRRLRLA